MRLWGLELENFKSYEHEVIDFSGVWLASVVGNNGNGKTTIPEAVVFALTGARTIRPLADFVRWGTDECRVIAIFSIGPQRYRVTRTVSIRGSKTTSALELACEGAGGWEPEGSGVTDTEHRLQRLLSLDEHTLLLTSFIGQQDAGAFFRLRAGERLEAVGKILRLDETYGPLEKHFKAVADGKRTALETSRRDLERLEAEVAQLEGRRADLAEASERLETERGLVTVAEEELEKARESARAAQDGARDALEAQQRLAELEKRHSALVDRHMDLIREHEKLTDRVARKADLERELESREEAEEAIANLAEAERADSETRKRQAVLASDLRAKTEAIQETGGQGKSKVAELERLNTTAADLNDRVLAIRGAEAPVCDRCGQPIADAALARTLDQLETELEEVAGRRSTLEQEVEQLRTKLAEQKSEADRIEAEISALPVLTYDSTEHERLTSVLARLNSIPAQLAEISVCEERLAGLSEELKSVRAELDAADLADSLTAARSAAAAQEARARAAAEASLEVQRREKLLEAHRREVSELEKAVARHEEAVTMLGRSAEKAEEIRAATKTDEQALTDAELLKHHFSKWGVPSLIIAGVLAALEAHVNEILTAYDAGFAIRFDTEKETKEGSRDSLEIMVFNGRHWARFELFSGGEQYRIASSMRLGLARLLAHRSGARMETVVLDEPEGLDADGRQYLARILEDLSQQFGLVLLLSHYDDLKEALPSQIRVSRDGEGRSRVEVAA